MKKHFSRVDTQALYIPEGLYNEAYTPAPGPVVSPKLGKIIPIFKIHLSDDCNVTGKSAAGNTVTSQAHKAGPCPYLWSQITSVSSGSVWIIHDGNVLPKADEAVMNYPIKGLNQ